MLLQSDINTLKNTLREIASQAYNLAMGLQNAAPIQTLQASSGPPKSVQYLLETSLQINKVSKIVEEFTLTDSSKSVL